MAFFQISTTKLVKDFNSNETELDKSNPYHGVLTLTLQSKTNENHNGAIPRGPGRPPAIDVTIDDLAEPDDPVSASNAIMHNA